MAKKPKIEKPKVIVITSVKLTRRYVSIKYTQGEGNFALKERDNPLPSFGEAMSALAPLVSLICHFPEEYHDEGLRVMAFDIGTKGGAQTVVLHAQKDLDDASKQFEITTPEHLLEQPTEEGQYSQPLTEANRALVWDAIEEARKYIVGERTQGQLAMDDDEDGKNAEEPPLKFDTTGAQ